MNFKDWAKISDDGSTCTLEHPKGHRMTIALKALPKIQQEQIKRLKFAAGGKVEKAKTAIRKGRANYDDGTPDSPVSSADAGADNSQAPAGNHTPITINVGTGAPAQGGPPAASIPQITPPKAAAPAPALLSDQTLNAPEAVGQARQAIADQGSIDASKAQQQAQYENDYVKERQRLKDLDQQHYNELKQHTDDFANYVANNPINAKAYQENMGTGQKVTTGLGLFLGGMGSTFGGHNYAMDFLNNQIARDIDAQKARSDQQKTVWGAYKDLYGDSNIATNLAKVSANDILVGKARVTAAQLGTAQAAQNAKALAAQKAIENNQLLIDSAGRLGTLRTGGGMPAAQPNGQNPGASGKNPGKNGPNPGKNQAKDWYEDHILSPNADKIGMGLQYNPLAKPNLQAIQDQKARADLADKALATINDRFPKIAGTTGEATYARNMAMPFVGSAPLIGGMAANWVRNATDTPSAREYETHRSAIVGAVRGALQGNVSDELLDSTVMSNLPEKGDDTAAIDRKMKTLKEFIKSHTKTDLLRPLGMSKE
jgi:hypothetical protein